MKSALSLWFVIPFFLFSAGGTAMALILPKGDFLIWLNQWHGPVMNPVFLFFNLFGEGWLFALLAGLLFVFYRMETGLLWLLVFGASGLAVQFLKKFVFTEMPRPKLFFEDVSQLNLIENFELHAHNSFPSGHSTTAFAMLFLATTIIRPKWLGLFCFFLAAGSALARVYLVLHFLQDIVAGAILGVFLASLMYWAWQQWASTQFRKLNRSLVSIWSD